MNETWPFLAIHAPLTGLFFIASPHPKDRPAGSFLFSRSGRERKKREKEDLTRRRQSKNPAFGLSGRSPTAVVPRTSGRNGWKSHPQLGRLFAHCQCIGDEMPVGVSLNRNADFSHVVDAEKNSLTYFCDMKINIKSKTCLILYKN